MNRKVGNNCRHEISAKAPHFESIKKFMPLSLQTDASGDFSTRLNKISIKVEKCGKMICYAFFSMERHSHK